MYIKSLSSKMLQCLSIITASLKCIMYITAVDE